MEKQLLKYILYSSLVLTAFHALPARAASQTPAIQSKQSAQEDQVPIQQTQKITDREDQVERTRTLETPKITTQETEKRRMPFPSPQAFTPEQIFALASASRDSVQVNRQSYDLQKIIGIPGVNFAGGKCAYAGNAALPCYADMQHANSFPVGAITDILAVPILNNNKNANIGTLILEIQAN
jgi:hypothetical protein